MGTLNFARLNELPATLEVGIIYIIPDGDGKVKLVVTGNEVSTPRVITSGPTDEEIQAAAMMAQMGDISKGDTSELLADDSVRKAFGKHESRLDQIQADKVGDGRWPVRAVEKMEKPGLSARIAIFGDSFSAGMGLPGHIDRDPPDFSTPVPVGTWTNVFEAALKTMVGSSKVSVDNYAFRYGNQIWDGGALENTIDILETQAVPKPDIAVLSFGIEDVENGESHPLDGYIPAFTTEYAKLITYFQSKGISVILMTSMGSPFNGGYGDRMAYRLLDRATTEVAKNANVGLLDVSSLIDDIINNNLEGITWDSVSTDGSDWKELAHYYVGTYAATFSNGAVVRIANGMQLKDNDSRWADETSGYWTMAPAVAGLPSMLKADFALGKNIQNAWVWNMDPRLSATVQVFGTGTDVYDETPVELTIEQFGKGSPVAYTAYQKNISTDIICAERNITTRRLPLGLSKLTYKVKAAATTTATTVYTAPLRFDRCDGLKTPGGIVIPMSQWGDGGDTRLYLPKETRFCVPSDSGFTVAMSGISSNYATIGVFNSVAINIPRVPGLSAINCALGVDTDLSGDTARLCLISLDKEADDMIVKTMIDTPWTFSSMGDKTTGEFSFILAFSVNASQGKTFIGVYSKAGAQLKSIDVTGYCIPWGGWCGALADNLIDTFGTQIYHSTYAIPN